MIMTKVIKYSITTLGIIELDENDDPTEQQILDMIADDYYQTGGKIEYANDVEYEVEEM